MNENDEDSSDSDNRDVYRLTIGNKEYVIIGTAHISKKSVDLVRDTINKERPDCVCLELDERRYQSLIEPQNWKNLDLRQIIRKKQLSTLIIQIMLASFQKRLGYKTGVLPGMEMMEAARIAEQEKINIALCDRDARITLRRAWASTPFFKKSMLLSSVIASLFDQTDISEDQLEELRDQDVLSEMLKEIGTVLPEVKHVLIDERDVYLAEKIRNANGGRIVAVVGAGHVQGIIESLKSNQEANIEDIEKIPPPLSIWKYLGWGIPFFIIGSIAWIGYSKGPEIAGENLLYWILANGIPSAIGAIVAAAHPLTILSAFLAAPFTSLTPVIGAGYVTAFIQAWLCPPRVREIQNVATDVSKFTQWWQNRLLRIFLAFLLPGFGSFVGTWIGGVEIFKNLL